MKIKKIILLAACCFSISLSFCEQDYLDLFEKVSYKGIGGVSLLASAYFSLFTYVAFMDAYDRHYEYQKPDKVHTLKYRNEKIKERNKNIAKGVIALSVAGLSLGSSIYFFRK
jgi:hypothetical protein